MGIKLHHRLSFIALATTGLVVGLASPISAKPAVEVGPLHSVLTSSDLESSRALACLPDVKSSTPFCYLVGEGLGGTAPAGTTPQAPFDYQH